MRIAVTATTALVLSLSAVAASAASLETAAAAAEAGGIGRDDDEGVFYHPPKISYQALVRSGGEDESFADVLSSSEGMIVVTDIPGDFSESRDGVMSSLDACMDEEAREESSTQEFRFGDGSLRRTLATKSVPGGMQAIIHRESSSSRGKGGGGEACKLLEKSAPSFRSAVGTVTQAFADRLTEYLFEESSSSSSSDAATTAASSSSSPPPLLETRDGYPFSTFASVVENGDHLEHFHSYHKSSEEDEDVSTEAGEEETIEMHTDQGLFIVFTPGRWIRRRSSEDDEGSSSFGVYGDIGELSSGFFIRTRDGSTAQVAFEPEDDLVVMLGDGVDQLDLDDRKHELLRAVPHALFMESHGPERSRAWYGRMVLPPFDALHPRHDGVTYGALRQGMIDQERAAGAGDATAAAITSTEKDEDFLGMGCSGHRSVARDLSSTTCENDTIYCWHRCMEVDYEHDDVGHEICESRNLQLLCINPRLEISDGNSHGDFYPACADSDAQGEVTPFPTLPEYPRSEEECADELFAEFADDGAGYDHSRDLPGNATLMWSVQEDGGGQGVVRARLAYDGLFGYLALGFAKADGRKNGMHGATIIMALPGGNFSGYSGLDLSHDPTIAEYVIDPNKSTFRAWSTPVGTPSANVEGESYSVESNDCFTALTFQASSINGMEFNVTGWDDLVWAANGEDTFVGYHGQARGRFQVNWASGEVMTGDEVTNVVDTNGSGAPDDDSSGTSAKMTTLFSGGLILVWMVVVLGRS